MLLKVYEMNNNRITGYKVYDSGKLIATLELRNNLWIAAILKENKIKTSSSLDFKSTYEWIILQSLA